MNISESYKKRLQELGGIKTQTSQEELLFVREMEEMTQRMPWLKYYKKNSNKISNGISYFFQKNKNFENKSIVTTDRNTIPFINISVFSELTFLFENINEKNILYVNFKNEIIPTNIEDINLSPIEKTVVLKAISMKNDSFSFSKEIITNEREIVSEEQLNEIINNLNKITFNFEEYLDKNYNESFYE
jgi:triacylglycerol esterase/lipase EstA (alpha/beta hydrolase family)